MSWLLAQNVLTQSCGVFFVRNGKVYPLTLRVEGRSLIRVKPERPFSAPPSKAGLAAAERVKNAIKAKQRLWKSIDAVV